MRDNATAADPRYRRAAACGIAAGAAGWHARTLRLSSNAGQAA